MNRIIVNRLNIRQARNVTFKAIGFLALLAVILGCNPAEFDVAPAVAFQAPISRFPSAIEEDSYEKCMDDSEAAFAATTNSTLNWYRKHGGRLPKTAARPRMIRGTNGKIVVLVHGFLASPADMKDMTDEIARHGYTVVLPLMRGFGADKEAVNASQPKMWQASIQSAIELAKRCHSSVSVVAHSLGGGLTTDLIANKSLRGVRSLVLLAPYFRIGNDNIDDALSTMEEFTDAITMKEMTRIFDLDFYDLLKMDRPAKDDVDPFLPMKATRQVIALHTRFERTQFNDPLLSPKVLLVSSQSDEVVDHNWAEYYPSVRFTNLTKIIYTEKQNVSHSLQTKKANAHFAEMMKSILNHIE